MIEDLIFRADATTQIGAGHIMRSIALAQAWQERGGRCLFVSHCSNENIKQRILDEGFEFIPIEAAYPAPSDLQMVKAVFARSKNSWLVIDGYHFDIAYQQALKDIGYRLMVIDDIHHLSKYHCDVVLNQNIQAESFNYNCSENTLQLLGPRYILLRHEFRNKNSYTGRIKKQAHNILLTMGGGDPDNVTLKVIRALNLCDESEIDVRIVVGPTNPKIDSIKQELSKSPYRYGLLMNPGNMPDLMNWADMAITAGGSTCWELAFMGIPAIILTVADNQLGIGENLESRGVAVNMGWYTDVSDSNLSDAIRSLMMNPEKREQLHLAAKRIIDGNGADKVVEILSAVSDRDYDGSSLRPVEKKDCLPLWRLANDQSVRRSSLSQTAIPLDDHLKWFENKLASQKTCMWVIETGGAVMGQVRYDKVNHFAEIDFSVAPAFRGRKIGINIISQTVETACKKLRVAFVRGLVKKNNLHSENTFLTSGFIFKGHKSIGNTDCLVFESPHYNL